MPRDFRTYRARLRSPPKLDVPHEEPRVDDGGNFHVGSSPTPLHRTLRLVRKAGHFPLLQEVDQANQHDVRIAPVAGLDQAAHRIENHHLGLKVLHDLVNRSPGAFPVHRT